MTPARPLPSAVRTKLSKLLPLLGSPSVGERAGAAAAIERVLQAHNLDWHDFTGAVTADPDLRSAAPPPPPRQPRPTVDPDATPMVMGDDEVTRLVAAIR